MKTFNFFRDEKMSVWYRGEFQVDAETKEEAIAKVIQMEKESNSNDLDIRWEVMDDTMEGMTPEENGNQPTLEIYFESEQERGDDGDGNLQIYDNVNLDNIN
jgi:hypothetical protein